MHLYALIQEQTQSAYYGGGMENILIYDTAFLPLRWINDAVEWFNQESFPELQLQSLPPNGTT